MQFLYAFRPERFTWFYIGYDGNGSAFEGTNGLQRTRDYYFAKFTIGLDGPALLGSLGMGVAP